MKRILVLSPDIGQTGFLQVVRDMLHTRGYIPRIHYFDYRNPPRRWLPGGKHDGVIFLGACPPEALSTLMSRNVPVVFQGIQYAHQNVDHTCGDERMAGALAAKHLIELGHKRIAVLVNEPHFPDVDERVRGFLNQAQLTDGIHAIIIDCRNPVAADARQAARNTFLQLAKSGSLDFTGLFTVSDAGAIPVLQICYEQGICVPKELSVIGCDNIPDAEYLCPALTTLEYSYNERADGLIDILEQRFAGQKSPILCKSFIPEIVLRKSTAPLGSMTGQS